MIYAVYVEDRLLDIDPAQVIAVTLQASAIGSGDIVNRKVSFTNSLKVPRTSNNASVLGWSHLMNAVTTFPYVKKSCRITANGLNIFFGMAIIESFDTFFNIQIYATPKDLSILIGSKVLSDLDFGDVAITWNAAFWDANRTNTTGWLVPVFNYGQINPALANGTIGTYYLPSLSYKDIITTIYANAGYTVSGTFYTSDAIFNNCAWTYSRKTWPGTTFKKNEILADDILQSDLLKDFYIKFGVFTKITGNNIELLTLEEILLDTGSAVDWTSKRANKIQPLEYSWDRWAQSNNFTFPDREFGPQQSNNFQGSIDIANDNIAISREVYKSLTHTSNRVDTNGDIDDIRIQVGGGGIFYPIYGGTYPVWETLPTGYTFDNDPVPMIALLRDRDGSVFEAASIRFNGVDRADYKVANPTSPVGGVPAIQGLGWSGASGANNGLLSIYYPTITSVLQTMKKVTRFYRLSDVDIYSLDLFTPIFDTDNYFLINKVNSYVSGRLTEVELLKIGFQS